MPDPDNPKPEPERGTGPVVILTARQLLGVFVLCAILGAATFLVNRVVGSVFLSLAVAVALFGFLGVWRTSRTAGANSEALPQAS